MDPFSMVVAIVLISVTGGLAKRYIDAKGRIDPAQTAEIERLKGQVGRLEDRIQVLERLATDKSARLASEIDQLR
jgi:hypothetical protein